MPHGLPADYEAQVRRNNALCRTAFDSCARKYGGEVNHLGQHSVLWNVIDNLGQLDDLGAGACSALAYLWIIMSIGGGDLMHALGSVRNAALARRGDVGGVNANIKRLGELAKKIGDAEYGSAAAKQSPNKKPLNAAIEELLRGAATADRSRSLHARYPYRNLDDKLVAGYYYYVYSDNHALALYCGGKTVDLYDPNVGAITGAGKGIVAAYLADCMLQIYNGLHPGGSLAEFTSAHGAFVFLAFRPQAALH